MVTRGWTKYATVSWNKIVAPYAMRVPIRNLRKLLWEEHLADSNTQKRFEEWSRGDARDIRFEIDTRIAAEMKGGFVPDYHHLDLYDIHKDAKALEEDGPWNAEAMYMDLTEALGIHYNMIDDSFGDLWPLFEECMKGVGRCIKKQDLSGDDKLWRIKYLAGWSTVVFSDFMPHYERELRALCASDGDLDAWAAMLDAQLDAHDIDDRRCYWAVRKKEILEARERVQKMYGS